VLSGILVGLIAGFAAVILKMLVHTISEFVNNDIPFEERIFIYAIFPMLGVILTALIVRYFFKADDDKELSYVLRQIAKNDSKIKSSKMYSQIIQSAVTVGFGGSAGLETPIALTGSAIGSNYSQRYRLGFKERTLLLAAGAAAGIAAAFNAPIAGVMFAFEILLAGLVFTDFIPLVIAAISGSLVSNIILNEDAVFYFSSRETFENINIFFYIGLGLLTGLYARYFLIVSQRVHHFFERFKSRFLWKAIVGGFILSALCVAFPPLFGEGYSNIKMLHQGKLDALLNGSLFRYFEPSEWLVVLFLGVTILLKAFATSITLGSGGNGGNFAPSLISGGMLGFLYGYILILLGLENVPLTNLMLVGMAGVLSGAMYAPLTAIFLIAESSSGYDLFIPLMLVAVIAYSINRFFSPINPVYQKLSDDGEIFTTRQDQNILSHITLQSCMNPSTLVIKTTESMDVILNKFRNSDETVIAVVDETNRFWGILNREQLRPFLLGKQDYAHTNVSKLAIEAAYEVKTMDTVMKIIKMFDEADVWQLPVLDEERNFIGFVSRSRILSNYRKLLKEFSE
jgi:CIC family chloride channel protein